jgi:hypothetical protein
MTRTLKLEPTSNRTGRNLAIGLVHPTHLEDWVDNDYVTKRYSKIEQNPKATGQV